jgi:hypothetical protein
MAKTVGYGSCLTVVSTSGADINTGQIRNITGPGVSGNDVDTTTMDSSSNYRTFVSGLLDPGEVTFSLVYDPTNTTHTRLTRMMGERLSTTFKVYAGSTSGNGQSFTGYVKGMSREIPMDDVITADVTIKVSGIPGYTS